MKILMVKRNHRTRGSGRPLTLALILLHTYTHIKRYSKINTKHIAFSATFAERAKKLEN